MTSTGRQTLVTGHGIGFESGQHFSARMKKLTPTSKYEIKVPNGVAGIRGTIYFINASGILRVLSGTVVIA